MSIRFALLALPLAALTFSPGAQAADAKQESKLQEALKGYEAGKPVNCINMRNVRSSTVYDRTAILYDMGNGLRYLNRPDAGNTSLRHGDIMVTRTIDTQLCNVDIVRMVDPGSQMQTGFVNLGSFVPYRKIKTATN